MIEPIAPQGPSATWQANLAAMQQQLAQKLFQSVDTNGDGSISKSEFEAFYNKFMGTTSQTTAAGQSSAADQLFGQLDTTGSGRLGPAQFSAALKQMMLQKVQGPHHRQPYAAAGAAAGSNSASSAGSSAPNSPTGLLNALLGSAGGSAGGQSTQAQNSGHLEFVA